MDGYHRSLFGLVCLILGAGCAPMLDEPLAPPGPADAPPPSDISLAELPGPVSDVPPPAPRLRRTKTLGQTDDTSFARGAPVAAPGGAGPQQSTTVIVHNHVQQNAPTVISWGSTPSPSPPPSYNNGNAGPGRGSSPSGGAPPVGGDWPQVPSYGPR